MARTAATVDLEAVLADALFSGSPAGTEPDDVAVILDAVAGLLHESGLRGWSVDDVAARAGVGRATVYRRFGSREALAQAALARQSRAFFGVIAAAVSDVTTLEEQLTDGFILGLDLVRASPLAVLLDQDPGAALSLMRSRTLLWAARQALIERYAAVGGRPDEEVEAVADALIRLGISYLLVPGVGLGGGPPEGPRDGSGRTPVSASDRHHLRSVIALLLRSSDRRDLRRSGPPR